MRKDLGLLIVRAAVGGTLAAHGAQKLFGAFGGGGIDGTAAMFEKGGFRPARHHALVAGLSETGGGALLALGLATPAAGAAALGTMAVAGDLHRPAGFFAQKGGFEYPMVLGAAGAGIALAGPGRLSLDRLLGDRLNRPWMALAGLAASVAAATFVTRRRQAALARDAQGTDAGTDTKAGAGAGSGSPAREAAVSGQAQVTGTRSSSAAATGSPQERADSQA